jgi:hypothetical protein
MRYSTALLSLLIAAILSGLSSCSYYFGSAWRIKYDKHATVAGNKIVMPANFPAADNPLVKHWADKELPDWKTEGKVTAPRVLLGKLLLQKDIDTANLCFGIYTPWGTTGTHWAFNPHGDYDFSEVPLCAVLYMFGNDSTVLCTATRNNLLNNLLTHSGNKTHERTPGSLGLMRETENHILMGETSRYLKNQWLYEHGDTLELYNNDVNGLNAWWMACLNQKLQKGFYEFNANPYSGYSITALLTFYTFCHNETVRNKCGEVLNDVFTRYAYSSLQPRRYPPFRRRLERLHVEKFAEDPVTSIVKVLLSKKTGQLVEEDWQNHAHHSLLALISNYELPDSIVGLLQGKKQHYFKQWGHGAESCPEIYSGNADYLLSAGGAQRGPASQIVVRPITLFLNDSAKELQQCFYLPGKGKTARWNMTGVYNQFACANHNIVVAKAYDTTGTFLVNSGWWFFRPYTDKKLCIGIYNGNNLGLLVVLTDYGNNDALLELDVAKMNSPKDLRHKVTLPINGKTSITYNVNAPKSKWVIKTVNGEKQNRRVVKWAY